MGGGLSSKNVSKLGSKEVSKKLRNFSLALKKRRSVAFTLAEVLITLGIIGIVAALTLPTVIQNYKEKVTVTLVKENYSIFSQALKMVTIDYPDFESLYNPNLDYKQNSKALYDEMSKHIKKIRSCDIKKGCMSESYTNLNGDSIGTWDNFGNIVTGVLSNGTTFWVLGYNDPYHSNKYRVQIGFDINGNKKPNRIGIDFFHLNADSDGNLTAHSSNGKYECCALNGTNTCGFNGYGCSDWIIDYGNMDYLKRDISKK